jgi:predicted dehydrogenase
MTGPLPASVAVVGGGRWARALAETLCALLPPSTALTLHSRSNAAGMGSWLRERGLSGRATASAEPPRAAAVLVANRAADHEAAAVEALASGAFVLLEKPLAPDAAGAERILARAGGRLAASQVLRWSRALELLARRCREAGGARSLSVQWSDAAGASRRGEAVRHDESLRVSADVLPHVCALVEGVLGRPPSALRSAAAEGGVERLALDAGGVPVDARLQRAGAARRRIVEARAGGGVLTLDFSSEPGTLSAGGAIEDADPLWAQGPRPLAAMVAAFLGWAAGGPKDPRLEPGTALLACRLADEAARRLSS